jgi:hypothetical protein
MEKGDLVLRLVVSHVFNNVPKLATSEISKFCQQYVSKFPESKILVKIYEEDFALKSELGPFFRFVDSTSGMGGDLFGFYQYLLGAKIELPIRESFSPFKKLNLAFHLSPKEDMDWKKLSWISYKEVSSNYKNSWSLVAFSSETGQNKTIGKLNESEEVV